MNKNLCQITIYCYIREITPNMIRQKLDVLAQKLKAWQISGGWRWGGPTPGVYFTEFNLKWVIYTPVYDQAFDKLAIEIKNFTKITLQKCTTATCVEISVDIFDIQDEGGRYNSELNSKYDWLMGEIQDFEDISDPTVGHIYYYTEPGGRDLDTNIIYPPEYHTIMLFRMNKDSLYKDYYKYPPQGPI